MTTDTGFWMKGCFVQWYIHFGCTLGAWVDTPGGAGVGTTGAGQ